MSRKFISAVLAASITVTGLSVQTADAGNRDLERFLVGATALLIIGAAINDSNKSQRQAAPVDEPRYHGKNRHKGHKNKNHANNDYYVQPRPLPKHVSRKLLPARCERTAWTRQGHIQVLAANCLNRNYRDAASMPRQCGGNFKFGNKNRGRRLAYTKQCLVNFGYRIGRG
jgi:hypothetical protein